MSRSIEQRVDQGGQGFESGLWQLQLRKCWKLRQGFDFAYKEVHRFQELPFWAHFAACAIAQFHTLLFIIILSNGLNYVLGFCPESGYSGVGRGLLWWPITDPDDLCNGG